jgi:hypothetical protein
MGKHLLVVLSNATEGGDDEFNRWYTNTHLGDILALNGYTAAQRFKLSETQLGAADAPYKYLALYEVDEGDLPAAAGALSGDATRNMEISPTLDRDRTVAWFFSAITERVTA